jgi:hypothetical protein
MSRWLPAVLWFFVSLWWFLADAWLARAAAGFAVDLGVAFCLFAALSARASALPWLVLCAALARALVCGGAACVHVLLLGVPIAALFPLRRAALPHWLVAILAAAILAAALPGLSALAQRLAEGAPPPLPRASWLSLLWTMGTAPIAAAVLGRLPPLWFFRAVSA